MLFSLESILLLWLIEKKEGWGIQVFHDGSVYEGWFKDNQFNRVGRLSNKNNDSYEGEFKNGEANGKGCYTYSDKTSLRGCWADNKIHGQGIETFPDGSNYKGDFVNGVKSGEGVYIFFKENVSLFNKQCCFYFQPNY